MPYRIDAKGECLQLVHRRGFLGARSFFSSIFGSGMLPPYHHFGNHIPHPAQNHHGSRPGKTKQLRGVTIGKEVAEQAEPEEECGEKHLSFEGLAGALGGNCICRMSQVAPPVL